MTQHKDIIRNTKGAVGTEQVLVLVAVGVLGIGGFTFLGKGMDNSIAGEGASATQQTAAGGLVVASEGGTSAAMLPQLHDPDWCSYHVGQCAAIRVPNKQHVDNLPGTRGRSHDSNGGGIFGAISRAAGNVLDTVTDGFEGNLGSDIIELGSRVVGIPFLPQGGWGEGGLFSRALDTVGSMFDSPLLGTVLPIPGLFGDDSFAGNVFDRLSDVTDMGFPGILNPFDVAKTLINGRAEGRLMKGFGFEKGDGHSGIGNAIRRAGKAAARAAKIAAMGADAGLFSKVIASAAGAAANAIDGIFGSDEGIRGGVKKGDWEGKIKPFPSNPQKRDNLTDPKIDGARASLRDAKDLLKDMNAQIARTQLLVYPAYKIPRSFADASYAAVGEAWNELVKGINDIDKELARTDIAKVYRDNLKKLRGDMLDTLNQLDPTQKTVDARADDSQTSARAAQARLGRPEDIRPASERPLILQPAPMPKFEDPCANNGPRMNCVYKPGTGPFMN